LYLQRGYLIKHGAESTHPATLHGHPSLLRKEGKFISFTFFTLFTRSEERVGKRSNAGVSQLYALPLTLSPLNKTNKSANPLTLSNA
jgi:hypothetical protein